MGANRTTKVTLLAEVSNYVAGFNKAATATNGLTLTAEQAAARQSAAATKIGTAFLAIGAVAVLGIGLAIKEFDEFDAKMSELQGLTGASSAQRAALTKAALSDGEQLAFTASQVADAEIQLTKAGLTVEQTIAALPGVLTLAAAAGIDTATATDLAAQAMLEFKLKASDIPHVADLLVAASDKTLTSVTDLAAGISTVAPVAHGLGISIDDVIGTLSAFSAAGLKGTAGASALQQTLIKLSAPSASAKKEMALLGISVYDANGQFIGLSGVAGELQDKLGGLTTAQRAAAEAAIFGARATKGANVLYADGAAGIQAWNDKVNENGAASSQAAAKLNNLNGDLSKLKDAFDTDLIESGSGANDILRELVQNVTGLVNGIDSLPAPVLQGGLALGTIVAITALVSGGFVTGVPKILAFRDALGAVGISGRVAAIGMGTVALVATALVTVMAIVGQANANAAADTEAYGETLDKITHKITASTRTQAVTALSAKGSFFGIPVESTYDAAQKLGVSLDTVTNAALGNKAAMNSLQPIFAAITEGDSQVADAASKAGLSATMYKATVGDLKLGIDGQNSSLKDSITAAKQMADAQKDAAKGADATAGSLTGVASSADSANSAVGTLADSLKNFGSGTLDARAAQRDFQQAVDDAATALKNNGATLDINTQAGRDNQAALDAIAQKANDAAAAIYSQTGSQSAANQALTAGSAALYAAAAQYGLTGQAADDYVASVLATPAEVVTSIKLNGLDDASAQLAAFKAQLGVIGDLETSAYLKAQALPKLPKGVTGSGVLSPFGNSANGNLFAYADGGFPTGIYAGRPGGIQKFAEPETGWELYVSGKKSAVQRNRNLLMEGAARLGMLGGSTPSPTPSLSSAPVTHVHNHYYNVTVPVSQSLIGDETFLAKKITALIPKAVNNGDVSAGWNG